MNRHNLPLTRHAANEYVGWVKIVKRRRLYHKSMGLVSMERVTVKLLYYTIQFV